MPFPWLAAATLGSSALGFYGQKKASEAAAGQQASDWQQSWERNEALSWQSLGNQDFHRSRVEGLGVDNINRERDLQQSAQAHRQAFDVGAEYGLTPQETAGSPVPGGTSVSNSSTLGNNQSALASATMQAGERAADRRNALQIEGIRAETALTQEAMRSGVGMLGQSTQRRGQDVQMSTAELQAETQKITSQIAANASITSSSITAAAIQASAQISANASKYTADTNRLNVLGQLRLTGQINDAQIAKISAETGLLMQDKNIKAALHDERWAKLFSAMSAENVVTSALALKHGLPLQEVLTGEASAETIKALQAFNDEVLTRSSYVNRETEAAAGIIKEGAGGLGNFIRDPLGFMK